MRVDEADINLSILKQACQLISICTFQRRCLTHKSTYIIYEKKYKKYVNNNEHQIVRLILMEDI